MKLFSSCVGNCCICACGNFCIAGIGDDDYIPASKYDVIDRLNSGLYKNYKDKMIQYLKDEYGYDYNENDNLKGDD